MKRILVTVLIFIFVLMVGSSFSQLARKPQVEIYAGAGFPLSPTEFKDYYKVGLSLNAQYVFFPSQRLGIPIFAGYERFTVDKQAISDEFKSMLIGSIFTDGSGNYYEVTDASLDSKGSASLIKFGAGIRPYLTSPEASTQIFLFGNASYNILKTMDELKSADVTLTDYYSGQSYAYTFDNSELGVEKVETNEKRFGAGFGAGIEVPAGSSFNLIFQGMYNIIFTKDKSTTFIGATAGVVF